MTAIPEGRQPSRGDDRSSSQSRSSGAEIAGKLVLTAAPFIVLAALLLVHRWLF